MAGSGQSQSEGPTGSSEYHVAIDSIRFDVKPGEAFGFLGPNGAGKSSPMKMIGPVSPGLINAPDLVLLDEPATGLDPQARHLLWDRLYRLKQQGVILIITTRYMDEACGC